METISMEMVVPSVPRTGPSGSPPETAQDASFGKTFAKVRQESGTETKAKKVSSPMRQDAKTVKDSLRKENAGGEKGHDPKVQEKDPKVRKHDPKAAEEGRGGDVSAAFTGTMVPVDVQAREISSPEMPVLAESGETDAGPAKMPAEGAGFSKDPTAEETGRAAHAPVPAEKLSLPELPVEGPVLSVEEQDIPTPPTAEARKSSAGKGDVTISPMQEGKNGTLDVPTFDVSQVVRGDSGVQNSAPPDRQSRGREMPDTSELPGTDLRMSQRPPFTAQTGKKELSRNRENSSDRQQEVLPAGKELPPQSDEEALRNVRKVLDADGMGSSWFREGFSGASPQRSFSSEGMLPAEGLGRGLTTAAPAFGKEQSLGLLNQVQSQLHLMAVRGREQITLHLHPEYLGKLKMKLSLQKHQLVAVLTTDSAMTREILSSHVHALKEALHDQGIRLERFDVQLQDNTTDGGSRQAGHAFQEQARQRQQERSYPGAFRLEELPPLTRIAEVSPEVAATTASNPGINLFV